MKMTCLSEWLCVFDLCSENSKGIVLCLYQSYWWYNPVRDLKLYKILRIPICHDKPECKLNLLHYTDLTQVISRMMHRSDRSLTELRLSVGQWNRSTICWAHSRVHRQIDSIDLVLDLWKFVQNNCYTPVWIIFFHSWTFAAMTTTIWINRRWYIHYFIYKEVIEC